MTRPAGHSGRTQVKERGDSKVVQSVDKINYNEENIKSIHIHNWRMEDKWLLLSGILEKPVPCPTSPDAGDDDAEAAPAVRRASSAADAST